MAKKLSGQQRRIRHNNQVAALEKKRKATWNAIRKLFSTGSPLDFELRKVPHHGSDSNAERDSLGPRAHKRGRRFERNPRIIKVSS